MCGSNTGSSVVVKYEYDIWWNNIASVAVVNYEHNICDSNFGSILVVRSKTQQHIYVAVQIVVNQLPNMNTACMCGSVVNEHLFLIAMMKVIQNDVTIDQG